MQKGFSMGSVLLGVAVVGVGLFLIKFNPSFLSTLHSLRSAAPLPVRILFLTKGSEQYCRQFSSDSGSCPSDCELRSSCPICTDIGCHAKGTSQVPSPSPSKTKTQTPRFEPGKIIVKFKSGISVNSNVLPNQSTNSTSINQLLEKIRAKQIKSLYYEENTPMFATASARDSNLERYYVISFSKDSDVEQIVLEFQADPGVEIATPNHYARIQ